MSYSERAQREIDAFAKVENIHDLPQVFHYWSNRFVGPAAEEVFATRSPANVYASAIMQSAPDGKARIISLGCGYGETEIGVANELINSGYTNFRIVCADISPVLIDRLRSSIPKHLSWHIEPIVCDVNAIDLDETFDCVMANHSLHHIVELEHVFDWAHAHLSTGGVFATCDMIGRNGHMRWPEVEAVLQSLWTLLPDRQRTNRLLSRVEERFINHDCSDEGFEGVRAQDILPLMLQRFHPSRFLGFGGLIDPFVDRCFGHNFSRDIPQDLAFINAVAVISDTLLDSGAATPTSMWAHFTKARSAPVYFRNRSPQRAVRAPWERVEWAQDLMEMV
jgi:SAM-dependent methyltransferase